MGHESYGKNQPAMLASHMVLLWFWLLHLHSRTPLMARKAAKHGLIPRTLTLRELEESPDFILSSSC